MAKWNLALPMDLKRAALEVYRSIRASGAGSVREGLGAEFKGARSSSLFTDLWHVATHIDFILGKASSPSEALHWLGVDDNLELLLRRLAAHIYMERTGDRAGSAAMLGVCPPGSASDIAPAWLVGEVTSYSKAEHQRSERVAADARRSHVVERGHGRARGRGGQDGRGGGRGSGGGGDGKSERPSGRGRGGGRGARKTQG